MFRIVPALASWFLLVCLELGHGLIFRCVQDTACGHFALWKGCLTETTPQLVDGGFNFLFVLGLKKPSMFQMVAWISFKEPCSQFHVLNLALRPTTIDASYGTCSFNPKSGEKPLISAGLLKRKSCNHLKHVAYSTPKAKVEPIYKLRSVVLSCIRIPVLHFVPRTTFPGLGQTHRQANCCTVSQLFSGPNLFSLFVWWLPH